jgi:lambda repressor-like predicted transcriptional regulator
MNDLYSTDHHALKEALDKKGWSPEMLSTFSGVHPGTVLRILSLRYPKSMKPERRDVARGAIICRLSKALRIRPQVLAPDLPELPPSPNPPAGPPPLSYGGDHRGFDAARERRRKLRQIEDSLDMEVA